MLNAARNFLLDAAPATCVPMGNGHINRTCLLTDEAGNKYTMQKINDSIFKDVPALMENIRLVTEYLRACDPDPRHSLQLVHTKDGKCFHHDETGYYRVYRFVDESVCLERAETQEEFFLSAQAFGSFQNQLAGKGFSMVEIVTSCPTNWGLEPLEALGFLEEKMIKEFPLGVIRDKDKEGA